MPNIAAASHILVKSQDEANKIKAELKKGGNFAKLAKKHSLCPSGKKGGDLGEFRRGTMLAAFDKVVFSKDSENQSVIGPVKTKAGFHLIQVLYKL